MTATYAIIKNRIQKTINVISTRNNSNRNEITREFNISMQRLRFRLKDYSLALAIRELHNRALKPN